ncbi:uncharacterized protein PV09_06057 [Verruconis gallopava]|uniref:Uncharacterized protein n=1 Tax=Verruconis gallopava TaxID=253628 RepID=A0A0D2AU07_9PEZI|nr:uncharacterized protein PV09_06057 [Verruconis gallopava]KIW02609.1 hypothetical protein PV09_06057 [Verruconis gallopava]
MAPSEDARKRKTAHENSTTSPKRLRRRREPIENIGTSSHETEDTPYGQCSAVSSSSSTPRTSHLMVSPLPPSTIAEEAEETNDYDDGSGDSVSSAPSSAISDVPPWDPSFDITSMLSRPASESSSSSFVRNLRAFQSRPGMLTKISDQWRQATREPVAEPRSRAGPSSSCFRAQNLEARPSSVPFLDVPRELRDQIYREIYVHDGAISIRQPKFHLPVRAHPGKPMALMRTHRQIYEEAMAIYIGHNDFILDLNILTAIDFLAAMPQKISQHFTNITLGKSIMSGYVRYELGMFDSSRLRTDLVKRLVYDWNLKTISIEVPDEHNPNPFTIGINNQGHHGANGVAPAGVFFNLSTFHPRHDYSWSLMRELVDVLLESGFDNLRLIYNTPLPPHLNVDSDPKKLLNLYALARILYLDDEYEVETQIKRIEAARAAGRRNEFPNKMAVERFVRERRTIRKFAVGVGLKKDWEEGSVIVIRRPGTTEKDKEKTYDIGDLMAMPGASVSTDQ